MNRQSLIVAAVVAGLVALGVFGAIAFTDGGSDTATMTMEDGSTMPAAEMDGGVTMGDADVPFDRAFIDAMIPHHEAAIEMAQEAQSAELTSPVIAGIAEDVIRAQQLEIDQMLAWRETWFGSRQLDPNAGAQLGMSDDMMGMGHETGMGGDAVDTDSAFAQAMIPHHEGAIAMAKLALERGQHAEIKRLANDIIAAQEREIAVLQPYAMG